MVEIPEQSQSDLRAVHELIAGGLLGEAESRCLRLLATSPHTDDLLQLLLQVYMTQHRTDAAVDVFAKLIARHPDDLHFYAHLADYLLGIGRPAEAIASYQRLLARQPQLADAHYNLALLQRKLGQFDAALASYSQALACRVSGPEEVWLNIGNLHSDLHRHAAAESAYLEALRIDPTYVPAMYNLAGMLEQKGDREAAEQQYRTILDHQPDYSAALTRLAQLNKARSRGAPLIASIEQRLVSQALDSLERQDLLFALGKQLDDCGDYPAAFQAFQEANAIAHRSNPRYDRDATAGLATAIIELFSTQWFSARPAISSAEPIFVCGMFRSGTTLVEQILAGHPRVTSGGELDFIPAMVQQAMQPFPAALRALNAQVLRRYARQYEDYVRSRFPDADRVTDKRPDNLWYLGLIRTLWPGAKIICTTRGALDNCLSIYFQQLGAPLAYATDLLDIGHRYGQELRLLQHWQAVLGPALHVLRYEELVANPEASIRALLRYCGLAWDRGCLEFYAADNAVNTASLWQVRQPLYTSAKGRWRNYERELGPLAKYLSEIGVPIEG